MYEYSCKVERVVDGDTGDVVKFQRTKPASNLLTSCCPWLAETVASTSTLFKLSSKILANLLKVSGGI